MYSNIKNNVKYIYIDIIDKHNKKNRCKEDNQHIFHNITHRDNNIGKLASHNDIFNKNNAIKVGNNNHRTFIFIKERVNEIKNKKYNNYRSFNRIIFILDDNGLHVEEKRNKVMTDNNDAIIVMNKPLLHEGIFHFEQILISFLVDEKE